ncbi:class I SAM-dependent methyltransferase [Planctomicrobium sp. SH664]|uniref:class I SAM-dependent methyltransferase n=1 Tax=Planctomicrobium sp. SH664 TaxID=3448125 RepID=UPI003F5BD3D6
MQVEHLEELIRLEESYWWHVAKRELVVSLLEKYCPAPGKLVEGGIGSARNLLTFREMGYDVEGFDVMPGAVEAAERRGLPARLHDLSQPWPVPENSLRAVVLLDVIEHIEDPVAVLSQVRQALGPEGSVIVTVPAYQWLYGDWDEALGHYRRYTCSLLREQATQAGLKIKRLTHWNAFTLPAAMAVRSCQKLFPGSDRKRAEFPRVAPWTNRLLRGCAAVERWMLNRMPVCCGLSVVGVLHK